MRMKLSTKAASMLLALILVALAGTMLVLLYAWRTTRAVDDMIAENVGDMITAAELDITLLRQRGLLASYMLEEGNKRWLEELDRLEPAFRSSLERAQKALETEGDRKALARVAEMFHGYDAKRDEVAALHERGEVAAARRLYLGELNQLYNETAAACAEVLETHQRSIEAAIGEARVGLRRLTLLVTACAATTVVFGAAIIFLLSSRVFRPLRRMTQELAAFSRSPTPGGKAAPDSQIGALGDYLRVLMSEVTEARSGLERSRRDLVHSERLAAIGNAVAHILHEIKNRLIIIGGFARQIDKHPDEPENARLDAQTILEEVARLERMLGEVMEFSRPVAPEVKVLSLNTLVEDVVSRFQKHLSDTISITLNLGPGTPDVSLDAERFEGVILNILRNSVEAMGSGTIMVKTRPHEDGAALIIEDDGPGITAAIRERIFEPFFSTKRRGTGLGLAISWQVVSERGGTIRCESSPGNGTIFTIVLPGA